MTTRGLQYIIDNASAIEISRKRTVGQMFTRSGRIRTAERTALQPYVLTVTPPTYARFEDVRDVIEGITLTDRDINSWIVLSNNSGLNYITDYQGELSTAQVNNLRVASTGSTATIFGNADFNTSPTLGYTTTTNFDYVDIGGIPNIGDVLANTSTVCTTSTVIFKAGDYLQLRTTSAGVVSWSTLRTVPLDVLRGSGTTVRVPVHRRWVNLATTADRRGGDLYIGNEVRLRMLITNMPNFKLLPGKIVEWTGDFELVENIN
jgi:hypothetical protein